MAEAIIFDINFFYEGESTAQAQFSVFQVGYGQCADKRKQVGEHVFIKIKLETC